MNKKEAKEFVKRYDKFKNNNLPTPFWDDGRQILEYVNYDSELNYWDNLFKSNDADYNPKLNVNSSIVTALEDITCIGFYYPYDCGHFTYEKDIPKIEVGHTHSHSFEEVVRSLYNFPESFKINKEEEKFYSKQQLDYLRRVQKYLLFIDLKDLNSDRTSIKRYRNKRQKTYGNAYIRTYDDKAIRDFLTGKRNFIVIIPDNINIYDQYKDYPNHNKKELVVDKKDNFKIFIEYTHQEIKTYQEIKNVYINEKLDDNTKIVVEYFKILERF